MKSPTLWKNFALGFMRRGRRFELYNKRSFLELSPEQLKNSVIACSETDKAWSSSTSRPLSCRPVSMGCHAFNYDGLVIQGPSPRYLLFSTGDEAITCWDLEENKDVGYHYTGFGYLIASAVDIDCQNTFCLGLRILFENEFE